MAELKPEGEAGSNEAAAGGLGALGGLGGAAAIEEEEEEEEDKEGQPLTLEFLSEVPLELSVEMGNLPMTIKDVLGLQEGSIIELSKFAGEPMDLYINGRLMAHGEIMAVNEKYGIRITDIEDPRAENEDLPFI